MTIPAVFADTGSGLFQQVQVRLGDYLATPRRVAELRQRAARVGDPVLRARLLADLAEVEARYQESRPLVERMVGAISTGTSLPPLREVPSLVQAAGAVLDVTDSLVDVGRRIDLTGPLLPAVASSSLLGILVVVGAIALAAAFRPSRRR